MLNWMWATNLRFGGEKSSFYFGHIEFEMPICILMLVQYKFCVYENPGLVIYSNLYQSNLPVDTNYNHLLPIPPKKDNYFKALENDQRLVETREDAVLIKESHTGEIRVYIVLTLTVFPSAVA